jgi:hypothetical protein
MFYRVFDRLWLLLAFFVQLVLRIQRMELLLTQPIEFCSGTSIDRVLGVVFRKFCKTDQADESSGARRGWRTIAGFQFGYRQQLYSYDGQLPEVLDIYQFLLRQLVGVQICSRGYYRKGDLVV